MCLWDCRKKKNLFPSALFWAAVKTQNFIPLEMMSLPWVIPWLAQQDPCNQHIYFKKLLVKSNIVVLLPIARKIEALASQTTGRKGLVTETQKKKKNLQIRGHNTEQAQGNWIRNVVLGSTRRTRGSLPKASNTPIADFYGCCNKLPHIVLF